MNRSSILNRILSTSLVLCLVISPLAHAEDAVSLREVFPVDYAYHVSTRVELTGSLSLSAEKDKPAKKPLSVKGESAIDYDERVLALADGEVQKTARIYRRIDFQRKIGEQTQSNTLRPGVRRLVVLRLKNQEVPFSPDGPLLWNEIDLVRTDVFTPALAGMLPTKTVQPAERWTATNLAIQELTDLEKIEEGRVECKLEEITTIEKRRYARVSFAGTVRGVNEDGPNRQQLDGYFFFDMESNHLSYMSLKGISFLLDKDGKEMGRIEGRFTLTRQLTPTVKELSEETLKGVALEPNADTTQLLYDNSELGVRFLYPRRWRVSIARGRQIDLADAATGNGLRLTLEPPAEVPTANQFLTESRDWLQQQQKTKIQHADAPRRLQNAPQELDQFALEVEMGTERLWMDYYVLRQSAGGATLAARLLPAELATARKDVERVARSVVIRGVGLKK